MIIKYKCETPFSIDTYDDDGFLVENQYLCIEKGVIFECDTEDKMRLIGDSDTVRLENEEHWIEISQDTLINYFSPI